MCVSLRISLSFIAISLLVLTSLLSSATANLPSCWLDSFTNFGVRASENSSWLRVSHGTLECHVIACRRFWWKKKSSKHRSPYFCSSSVLRYLFSVFLFGPWMPTFWYCLIFGTKIWGISLLYIWMEAYFHCLSPCFRASLASPIAFTSPDT